jgi:hypothetical protein
MNFNTTVKSSALLLILGCTEAALLLLATLRKRKIMGVSPPWLVKVKSSTIIIKIIILITRLRQIRMVHGVMRNSFVISTTAETTAKVLMWVSSRS